MKNPIKWVTTHIMLALVILAQIVFPAYSLRADCTEGEGANGYDYNPREMWINSETSYGYIHNDYTTSTHPINGSYIDMGNDNWVGAFTGTTTSPEGNYISLNLFNAMLIPQSGVAYIYTKDTTGGAWNLFSSTPFTNTAGFTAVIQIRRYGACRAGYKILLNVSGMATQPYIARLKNM